MNRIFTLLLLTMLLVAPLGAIADSSPPDKVMLLDFEIGILPGSAAYLQAAIEQAQLDNTKLIVLELDTPGGMVQSAQEIVKSILESPVPVIVFVSPSGATAGSAGLFVTVAAHVAAMAPGTSIGAAHPVDSQGQDIEGDLRKKIENMTAAMVESVASQRGRNTDWVKRAVLDSETATAEQAVKLGVVDFMATDIDSLLKKLTSRKIVLGLDNEIALEDYSKLPRIPFPMAYRFELLNLLANPYVASLLWLIAVTCISIELYNPGAILPGVVGAISLILGLIVMQVLPINIGSVALLVVGALMIGLELFLPSGILGLGGIVAIVFGSIYIVDLEIEPWLHINKTIIVLIATLFGLLLLGVVYWALSVHRRRVSTGSEALLGARGRTIGTVSSEGKAMILGEIWKVQCQQGIINAGERVLVKKILPGLVLEVAKDEE